MSKNNIDYSSKTMSVYIVIYALNDIVDGIIRHYTKDHYNHAALSFDKEMTEVYTFSMVTNSITKTNFSIRPARTEFMLYELKVSPDEYKAIRLNVDAILNDPEYVYNFKALFRRILGKEIGTVNKAYYCSEFVYSILKSANVYNVRKKNGLVLASSFTRLRDKKRYKLVAKGTVGNIRLNGVSSSFLESLNMLFEVGDLV